MRSLLTRLLVAGLAFVGGTQVLVPPFLAARVAQGLQGSLDGTAVQVQLDTFPAVRMLGGTVDRLTVTVNDVAVDGLALESLRLEAVDVQLDVAGLLRGEAWQPQADENVTLQAVVSEPAVAALVRDRLPEMDVDVRLGAEGLELQGRTTVLGTPIDLAVRGRIAPDETGTRLVFVPEEIMVGGRPLRDWVAAVLRETYTASVDLEAAPVPMVVEEVVHEPGRLIITGRPRRAG